VVEYILRDENKHACPPFPPSFPPSLPPSPCLTSQVVGHVGAQPESLRRQVSIGIKDVKASHHNEVLRAKLDELADKGEVAHATQFVGGLRESRKGGRGGARREGRKR